MAYQFITGTGFNPMCGLGWKSLGVLELTALPSIKKEDWVPVVEEADALLVWGGDVMYLCHWMRKSGLADILPSLHETVWVGVSSGSMVLTPNFGEPYDDWFCRGAAGQRSTRRRRQSARAGRLLAVSASGSPEIPGELAGQRRNLGGRENGADVRDR